METQKEAIQFLDSIILNIPVWSHEIEFRC
jgi:hypothetical protein